MSDTPTVVELAPVAPLATPPKPVTPPAAPAAAAMPGLPLAVATANAAGSVAAGAVALGSLARRTRNRANHRTHQHTSASTPAGARAAGSRAGSALGSVPAARRTTGAQASPLGGSARPAAASLRPGARAAAAHRTNTPQQPARTSATGTAAPPRPTGPAGTAGAPPRGRQQASTSPQFGARSGAGRPASAPASPPRLQPPRGATSDRQQQRSGMSGVHRPAGAAYGLAKAARANGAAAGARWSAASPARAEKAAARSLARLEKGRARAEQKAGITPKSTATTGKGRTGTGKPTPAKAVAGEAAVPAEQRKRLRRSAARHGVRMAGAALATGLVGAASVAAFNWRHKGKVTGHMRRTWARMAGRARAVRDARDAALRGTPAAAGQAPGVVPVPAEHVNRPGDGPATNAAPKRVTAAAAARVIARITLGKPTSKEPTVSESTVPAFSLSSAADVMLQAASTFDPEQMTEFEQLVDDLPVAFATIQEVLRVLAELSAESLPVDPVVTEEIGEGYRAMAKVVSALEEVGAVYRRAHEADIERTENPRNGLESERKWNV